MRRNKKDLKVEASKNNEAKAWQINTRIWKGKRATQENGFRRADNIWVLSRKNLISQKAYNRTRANYDRRISRKI